MDYEQKYNKLVEAVKVLQETNPSDEGIQNWVNDNVPELRESEDERIRKYLIYCVNRTIPESDDFNEISKEQILAWLEKQGQKPAWSEEDEKNLQMALYYANYSKTHVADSIEVKECINWLKSLKQRSYEHF